MTEPRLLLGDCIERLRDLDDGSVDAIVTDPPYGLGKEPPIADVLEAWLADRVYVPPAAGGFMGKTWDAFVPDLAVWRECFRALKPGGYLLSFSGTRTVELVAIAIRLAGFERRDLVVWMYGSGFPKSLDVAKAIDGAATAREWDGWGTALKPALEPIVVARKPLVGTVAENVLAHGTGALNIGACRIAFQSADDERESKDKNRHGDFGTEQGGNAVYGDFSMLDPRENYDPPGRWPANVILTHTDECVRVGERQVAADGHWPSARPGGSEIAGASGHVGQEGLVEREASGETVAVWECSPDCPVRLLDEQSGVSRSSGGANGGKLGARVYGTFANETLGANAGGLGDVGGASRFFYTAKTSRAERNAGLDDFPERVASVGDIDGETGRDPTRPGNAVGGQQARIIAGLPPTRPRANHHPTVKPVELMRWLVRLVARPGAVVCDPFLGSGTTGIACDLEGVNFVGIEREPEYLAIAEARMRFWAEHGEDALRIVSERDQADRRRSEIADAGQLDLFGQRA